MERIKRAVCLALCFVMVLGLLPIHAFATSDDALTAPQTEAADVTDVAVNALPDEVEPTAITGWITFDGETYYEKVTTMEAGVPHIITRTSSTYYALTRNDDSIDRTSVSISNNNGRYSITNVSDSLRWYRNSNGNIYCTVDGTNYYLNAARSYSWGGYTYYLANSTTASSAWTVTPNSGNVRISTTYYDSTRYVRYDSGFTLSTSNSNVSLYAEHALPGGQARLSGELEQTVRLNDGTTQNNILSKVEVQWDSNRDDIIDGTIPMSSCVVEGTYSNNRVGTYTLTISYQGKELGDVVIRVVDKTVVSDELTGNTMIEVPLNGEPNFSNIKYTVAYDDNSQEVFTVGNGLTLSEYDTSAPGDQVVDIYWNGEWVGAVTVRVTMDFDQLEDATEYPEYPADGAVRIDKTGTELDLEDTGVVRVELDVAGVSVKTAVDAVLTLDISNSMAWKTGTREYTAGAVNKLNEVMDAVKEFARIFLADNDDGTPTTNTITIVTFAGYDKEHWNGSGTYIDSVRTLVTGTSNLEVINEIANRTKFTAAEALDIAYIPAGEDQNNVDNITVENGANRGDTNYDYAFWQTEQAITTGNLGAGAREVHVLFMTDGCASNYNDTYYRTNNAGYYFKPGTKVAYSSRTSSNGTDWTNYIKNTLIPENDGNKYAKRVYDIVDGMHGVGFDMAHGSFAGLTTWDSNVDWEDVFNDIVSKSVIDEDGNGLIPVTAASDTAALNTFYATLARELRYAGTHAQVHDIVKSDFTLQMGNITGSTSANGGTTCDLSKHNITTEITVTTYDLWTKDETTDVTLIGTRKDGSEHVNVLETVTFNADGTVATSDALPGVENILNIAEDGTVTIAAKYFLYTKTPDGVETFDWMIGNITDKEIALSYLAYLKGSLEGERAKGLYYTNEEATLDYVDINGDHAHKVFPVPAVAWGGASTAYEFYLVNEDGEPCDRLGNAIPFANRIIITGPFFEELYLNQSGEYVSKEIIAARVLPAGYKLYDDTAKYSVLTASGEHKGSLVISDPAPGKEQTTIEVSATKPSYIQSRVAFGVLYNVIPEAADFKLAPDQVVIDYGKYILVDVAENNTDIPRNTTATLVGFSKYFDNYDYTTKVEQNTSIPVFDTDYGIFSIENATGTVRYTPINFVNGLDQIFAIFEINENDNIYYMVDALTVIPATTVYYETNFSDDVKSGNHGKTYASAIFNELVVFSYKDAWATRTDKTKPDYQQDNGEITVGHYGFDSSYDNDALYSNGTSLFAEGKGLTTTTTTFSFVGTGFDLISRTGTEQGMIKVEIYSDRAMTQHVKSVSVLNKSESNLELHQIPVVSVNDLPHGTYYVKIGVDVAFVNETGIAALDKLNRGDQFYFDAIRIYDPVKGNAIATNAYAADGELDPEINEVRALLLAAETFNALTGDTTGVVFVDRGLDVEIEEEYDEETEFAPADYKNIGPNNEVYLKKDQAIAFRITADKIPASVDIGAKSIDPDTAKKANMKVTIKSDANDAGDEKSLELSSATAQYIDLLAGNNAAGKFTGNGAYVVIENTGDGILSITDIKVAFSNTTAAAVASADNGVQLMSTQPYAVRITVGPDALDVINAMSAEVEEEQAPAAQILNASVKANGSKKNAKYTLTVVTSQETSIVNVAEGGNKLMPSKISFKDNKKTGTRVWTIVITNGVSERYTTFDLTAFAVDGTEGNTVSVIKPR